MASPRLAEALVRRLTPFLAGTSLVAAGLLPLPSQAQQLFCCQLQGKRVCGDRLPDQCVGKPHTVRDPGGVVRQVEGMLTPEQRAQKEAEEKRLAAEKEAQAEQRRRDSALLATYTSEKDIEAARQRAEGDVQATIKQAEEKMVAAEKRRRKFDSEAEFYRGKEMPDTVRRGQKDADYEINAQRELIQAKKKELDGVREKFATEKRRFQELNAQRSMH